MPRCWTAILSWASCPLGFSDQRPSAIKDPPAWFYGDWEEIERKAAMEKTKLLAKYWKEEAIRQEGKDMKARYTRVNAIKAAKGLSE